MRRGRPERPQRLIELNRRPSIPGCPFEAAEDYEAKAWYRLRHIRQWSPRKIESEKRKEEHYGPA